MSPAHRLYAVQEAAIGAVINGVLSLVFALIVFHGVPRIAASALIFDAIPQNFMVALMSMAVPTLLTRRRVAAGAITSLPAPGFALPRMVGVRALLVAVSVATIAWLAHALLMPVLLPHGAPFGPVLVGKTFYGALLGALMTLLAVRHALADRLDGKTS